MVTISPGHKQVAVADANTYCGIFLRKSSSGDLIPMARSYHGHDWEPSPGPLACNTEDVSATTVIQPMFAIKLTHPLQVIVNTGVNVPTSYGTLPHKMLDQTIRVPLFPSGESIVIPSKTVSIQIPTRSLSKLHLKSFPRRLGW